MLGSSRRPRSIAVLTSGGDAAGMNAAVRAVVRRRQLEGEDQVAARARRCGEQGHQEGLGRAAKRAHGFNSIRPPLRGGGARTGLQAASTRRNRASSVTGRGG